MESYDITKSARAINNFVINDLSNWYIRRNRRRFWKSENGKDKTAAYQTLFECLIKVSELMAPISPFISDLLYKNLTSVINKNHNSSVHLAEYPIADKSSIDNKLEDDMNMAVTICEHVRAMRMKSNLKIRQPLQRILIPIIDEKQKLQVERMKEIILDEINVKEISFVSEESGIVKKKAKANFRTLGVKFGKGVQPIATAIKELNSKQISELQRNNKINLSIDGNNIEIVIDDVEIIHEEMIGFMVESNNIAMVALDTTLTPELLQEGLAREFVNRIQNMRKDANFNVMDRIAIYFKGTVNLEKALINMENYIKIETLATNLSNNFVTKDFSAEDEINGEKCSISIEKVVTLAGKF